MFKALLLTLAIAFTPSLFAQSKAATEAWVKNYVSNHVAAVKATLTETYKDGVRTLSITENETNLVVKIEDATTRALILKKCAPILSENGITNGMIFAYTDNGVYRNGRNIIQATKTNLVLNATYQSSEANGLTSFYNNLTPIAEVYWTLIQPSIAKSLGE
jgi:hypothetical protein